MPALFWIIAGALTPLLLSALPPDGSQLVVFALGLTALTGRRTRRAGGFLVACAWTLLHLQNGLRDRLPTPEESAGWLSGTVVSLPRRQGQKLEFLVAPDAPVTVAGSLLPGRVLVRWYRDAPEVRAGERWRLMLRLRPPRGRVNFSGPDSERAWFARRIVALGSVAGQGGQRLEPANRWVPWLHWRDHLRGKLHEALTGHAGAGLVLALAVADRDAMTPRLRTALLATGTAHLLAISGLHIGLVAMFAYGLTRMLMLPVAAWFGVLCSPLAAWVSAVFAALTYAALAGFATSTTRALTMLAVVAAAHLARRQCSPLRSWWLALGVVLLMRPLSPLEAGFWLSFAAVGVLLWVFVPRPGRVSQGRLRGLVLAQSAITLLMLPLGMQLFQTAALGGLVANLLAIPFVSSITLPLVLGGSALALPAPGAAEVLLQMAADSGRWLTHWITWTATLLQALHWPAARPGVGLTVLAVGGILVWLMPAGLCGRWLASLVMLPALVTPSRDLGHGEVELRLLDVGQGLAALLRTRNHSLLYDSGPGWPGQWDLQASVLAPALASLGHSEPDRIVISHGDLDHAGGLGSLRRKYGDRNILASLLRRDPSLRTCHDRYRWIWDGVSFEVLHPGPFLPYRGNASSCVIGVRSPAGSLLLPGDIDSIVENALARKHTGGWEHVLAPHHGSRSSNSAEFLAWARPHTVLVANGIDNRFGFPHDEVLRRIVGIGARTWTSADCGAIELRLTLDGSARFRSARRVRTAPWRWPAAPDCP